MLLWIFGDMKSFKVEECTKAKMKGTLILEKAKIKWFLSVDKNDLPKNANTAYRSLKINNEEFNFSDGFTELHTEVYKKIIEGKGFKLQDAKPSIDLVYKLRKNNGL
jgi:UDP-N-acetyl-2-amino-2-deoxyglucuronate dehydrogenase